MRTEHEAPDDIRALLVRQLSSPVRWSQTLQALATPGVAQVIECGPGKVLTGLNRRIERRGDLSFLALEDPASIDAALAATRGDDACWIMKSRWSPAPRAGSVRPSRWPWRRPAPRSSAPPPAPKGRRRSPRRSSEHGYAGRGAVLDAGSAASIDALMAELDRGRGIPDILINNAAITRDTLLLRMKPEDWDAVIATNLTAVFRLSKACVRRMMKERRGRIVNLTSVVGLTGNAGQVNYAAAKAGLLGIHQVARQGTRLARHHGERRGAGLHRHRHDARA